MVSCLFCCVDLLSGKSISWKQMSRLVKVTVRPAKTQISLGGCPDWSEPSLGAQILLLVCHEAAQMSSDLFRSHLNFSLCVNNFLFNEMMIILYFQSLYLDSSRGTPDIVAIIPVFRCPQGISKGNSCPSLLLSQVMRTAKTLTWMPRLIWVFAVRADPCLSPYTLAILLFRASDSPFFLDILESVRI